MKEFRQLLSSTAGRKGEYGSIDPYFLLFTKGYAVSGVLFSEKESASSIGFPSTAAD